MKVDSLKVDGLRGIPVPFELDLAGKSLFLFGENGFGKSTVTDAFEFWSTGDLAGYHRAGKTLGSAVHLDVEEAEVTVRTLSQGGKTTISRKLFPNGKDDLVDIGTGSKPTIGTNGMPILRHETIGKFMDMSGADKQKELLELLGLDRLTDMRAALVTARNSLKRRLDTEEANRENEREALESILEDGLDLEAYAKQLATDAGLPEPARIASQLEEAELKQAPHTREEDRAAAVAALKTANEHSRLGDFEGWNEAVTDRDASSNKALAELLRFGQELVQEDSDTCPLCEGEIDGSHLRSGLEARAEKLREANAALDTALEGLDTAAKANARLSSALSKTLELKPDGGWSDETELQALADSLETQAEVIASAKKNFAEIEEAPLTASDDLISSLETDISNSTLSPALVSLVKLHELKKQVAREAKAKAKAEAAKEAHASAETMVEVTEQGITGAINDVLDILGSTASDYFDQIVSSRHHSDVKLVHRPGRHGEVEFVVLYDRRTAVTPPQRSMSTSQLNALALSLFLARVKVDKASWKVCVLDDVVNSFDIANRRGLLRLLREEFEDWQVILLTHDRVFFDLGQQDPIPGWRLNRIDGWTPQGGPVLGEGAPLDRLKEKLAAGKSADEMGGDGRVSLEWSLSRPLKKLSYDARFDPQNRHAARELLDSLTKGLNKGGSPIMSDPVFGRLAGASYMSNLGVHHRTVTSGLQQGDFQDLVRDLEDLDTALTCANCGTYVWNVATKKGHACGCGNLTA